jgi:hypothetical protein
MRPTNGSSGIADSITGKPHLSEKVIMLAEAYIKPRSEFQLPTPVLRFKMLHSLDTIQIVLHCVMFARLPYKRLEAMWKFFK